MQEQYDRKKVELEQKLLREKAELAKVNGSLSSSRNFHMFSLLFHTTHTSMSHHYIDPSRADAFKKILQKKLALPIDNR